MSDEVWWLSRDDISSTVEIRGNRPVMIETEGGRYAMGNGFGMYHGMVAEEFRRMFGFVPEVGEIIPIRPLRIERVEVKK